TAAHCVVDFSRSGADWYRGDGRVEIVLERDDLTLVSDTNVTSIADVVKHEAYTSASQGDDIALIRLSRPWSGSVSRLSLDPHADPSKAWVTPLMVSGFGVQEDGGSLQDFVTADGKAFRAGSARLLETPIPLTDQASCRGVYASAAIGRGQICAG